MTALTFFTARLYLYVETADEANDIDINPQTKGVNAGVTITPQLINNEDFATPLADALPAGTLTPNAALVVLAPVRARIDNGRLKIRADDEFTVVDYVPTYADLPEGLNDNTDRGKAWIVASSGLLYVWDGEEFPDDGDGQATLDQLDVRLVAETAVLTLPENTHLGYRLDFDHVTFNGADQDLPSFAWQAPTTDVLTDLSTVTRVKY